MEDRFWSVDEVSGYLGVKRDTVYKWIGRRKLPAHKLGRLWKFRKEEVDNWVASEQSSSRAAPRRSSRPSRRRRGRQASNHEGE